MKITTKTGDFGETSNLTGKRVKKNSLEIEIVGQIDELQSVLGVVKNFLKNEVDEFALIEDVQSKLYDFMSIISGLKGPMEKKFESEIIESLEKLENYISIKNEGISFNKFVLPGKNTISSFLHLARSVCRRCERVFVAYLEEENIDCEILCKYMNRLSDFLFIMAEVF